MGNYVNNNLIRDEKVEYETTYHWIIFFTLKSFLTLFIAPALQRWSDEFVITNKRVVIKTGLFSRKTFEMNLSKSGIGECGSIGLGQIARFALLLSLAPVAHVNLLIPFKNH